MLVEHVTVSRGAKGRFPLVDFGSYDVTSCEGDVLK
jgi:hypothetical protein